MGRMRENPRYNVISMRISDEERDTLEEIMNTTHKSVSDIMREAMDLLKTQLTSGQMNQQAA
jgi:ribbon-helix-helix CopG family protein